MNIAVIGSGVSGMIAAKILSRKHRVTLYEADNYPGGHVNTIDVVEGNTIFPVDTGFIVFNEVNYPNLCRLFDMLDIKSRNSDMSFSVKCQKTGLEYNGTSVNKIFAQRKNLISPSFLRMLKEILHFHKASKRDLNGDLSDDVSVQEYVTRAGFSKKFVNHYLLPLGAALWSCDLRTFSAFPMRFVIEFLSNHRMLQVEGRPQWKTVVGGSREYVKRLIKSMDVQLRLSTAVLKVRRSSRDIEVETKQGHVESFDEVILATHADQSLDLVEASDTAEQEILRMFPYQKNQVTVHTDIDLMPHKKKAWASWNYRIPKDDHGFSMVTYNMNMLQSLESDNTYLVSLNQQGEVDAKKVLRNIQYHHPVFIPGRDAAQREHGGMIRRNGISYCGAYWGYGFHEDGIRSALNVCAAFDMELVQ